MAGAVARFGQARMVLRTDPADVGEDLMAVALACATAAAEVSRKIGMEMDPPLRVTLSLDAKAERVEFTLARLQGGDG